MRCSALMWQLRIPLLESPHREMVATVHKVREYPQRTTSSNPLLLTQFATLSAPQNLAPVREPSLSACCQPSPAALARGWCSEAMLHRGWQQSPYKTRPSPTPTRSLKCRDSRSFESVHRRAILPIARSARVRLVPRERIQSPSLLNWLCTRHVHTGATGSSGTLPCRLGTPACC